MKNVKLFVAEDQQILRVAFRDAFSSEPTICLVGISEDGSGENIVQALSAAEPDVVLIGTKRLQADVFDKLESIREKHPQVGIILLPGYYSAEDTKHLRALFRRDSRGCACLLKYSIDSASQLVQVIHAVAEGRVILDSAIMGDLIADPSDSILRELTPRELEILGWMAKGYKNSTIAEVLFLELKTVERHINSIYSKLHAMQDDSQQARVHAILLYLKATGQLVSGPVAGRRGFDSESEKEPLVNNRGRLGAGELYHKESTLARR